jgi:protein-tyrosine phosphatase
VLLGTRRAARAGARLTAALECTAMLPAIYWIPEVTTGRLGIMARPRSGEWLQDEVMGWCSAGLNVVVCLLEEAEIRELGLRDEQMLCEGSKIEFISFPISDRGVPASVRKTVQLAERVVSFLNSGATVAIHCRAGIGRTGLVAACVLLKLGFPASEVFPLLSRVRGVSVPDTSGQVQWLSVFSREAASAL